MSNNGFTSIALFWCCIFKPKIGANLRQTVYFYGKCEMKTEMIKAFLWKNHIISCYAQQQRVRRAVWHKPWGSWKKEEILEKDKISENDEDQIIIAVYLRWQKVCIQVCICNQ